MKKLLCAGCSIALCLSLVSCGGASRESAESVVESGIKAFQSMNQEEVQKYWGDTDFSSDVASATSEDEEYGQQILEKIASGLTYEITGSTEDEEAGTATVSVDFTNIDMGTVMSEWVSDMMTTAIGYAFLPEDQQPSEDELNQMYMDSLTEVMDNNKDNTVTNSVDVQLSLTENKWKIDSSDEVVDAMVGGMMSYADSMGNSFGGAETETPTVETARINPATLGDYTVEIKSTSMTQDYDGNPVVVVTYSWTNNSSETTTPMGSVTTKVFQDGVGLEGIYIVGSEDYDPDTTTTEVRPGTTIDVQEAFILNNTISPIEVEISEAYIWDTPSEVAYMEFDVA